MGDWIKKPDNTIWISELNSFSEQDLIKDLEKEFKDICLSEK